jgi:hypothetical protein
VRGAESVIADRGASSLSLSFACSLSSGNYIFLADGALLLPLGQRETSPWLEDKRRIDAACLLWRAELRARMQRVVAGAHSRADDYYFIITAVDINFNWRTLNYTPRRRCVCRELTAKFYIISLERVKFQVSSFKIFLFC